MQIIFPVSTFLANNAFHINTQVKISTGLAIAIRSLT